MTPPAAAGARLDAFEDDPPRAFRLADPAPPDDGRHGAAEPGDERAVFLSTEFAGGREMRIALVATLVSGMFFLAAAPFAKIPLTHIPAFVPIYVSALVICDVITAVLLFGQFSLLRAPGLLVLGSGYVFTASMTSSYVLMFPGLFSATSPLGAGPQTTSAMYMLWHCGFPLAVIGYAMIKDAGGEARGMSSPPRARPRVAILGAVAAVIAVVVGFSVFATAGHHYLPQFIDGDRTTDLGRAVLTGEWLLSFLALVVLWWRRPHMMIDLWLMVVMSVWLFDMALAAILNTGRYDLGWYVGRIYGLLAASFLLAVMLIENANNYARLVRVSAKLGEANKSLERQSLRTVDDLRRYRGLLEAAPDAMVVVNPAGEIVLSNLQAEKQFGYRRDELLGQQVTSIIPDGFAERLIADRLRSPEDARAQQIGSGIELRGQRKDGGTFPIEIMLSPTQGADGGQVTAAIRDISARKTAEAHLLLKMAELNRSNEELGLFASIASHDLQAPLRMVSSYTQLLAKRYKGRLDADADEFIAFAVDGVNRMQRLIQDLLMFSRVGSAGKQLIETSSEDALREALQNLRGAIEDSGAVVTHDPLPMVMADAGQLVQLFQNLVGNAIKYQNTGTPLVHVAATPRGGAAWEFSVRDNGLGIEPRHFEKIFGMFQRLHSEKEFAGTGIGLAICKKIVERHGGGITVESSAEHGSTFRFSLAPVPADGRGL
jgi:PAS domain S-box-containing protein